MVALRKESVDRNIRNLPEDSQPSVALRKESVDRNSLTTVLHWYHISVALRKESVDRNDIETSRVCTDIESLSARRAWIEMYRITITVDEVTVALRKESVDRNDCSQRFY